MDSPGSNMKTHTVCCVAISPERRTRQSFFYKETALKKKKINKNINKADRQT